MRTNDMREVLALVFEPKEDLSNSFFMKVAAHLWGAPMDFEGRNVQEVKEACSGLSEAVALSDQVLKGTPWRLLLRQLEKSETQPYRYLANISRPFEGTLGVYPHIIRPEHGRIHTKSYAMLSNCAVVMALISAVAIERAIQERDRLGQITQ